MADIARKANAQWLGNLRDGKGTISSGSGTLKDAQYSFGTRFENGVGTNPEELLAAHGHDPQDLRTEATCEMVRDGAGFKISAMRLTVRGKVGNIDDAEFQKHVAQAAEVCPLSRVIKGNAEVSYDAVLE